MSSEVVSIAVGSSGSATGHGVLSALSDSGFASRLVACDTNPRHLVAAGSLFAFVQTEPAADLGYADTLSKTLQEEGVSAFYPIHDIEVAVCAEHRETFEKRGILVLAPAYEAVATVRDKLRMFKLFAQENVASPPTVRLDAAEWSGGALHFKPRSGVGSQGVGILRSSDALHERQTNADAMSIIVQPFVEGQEITIDIFCPHPGEVLACCCRERIEVKAGVSSKARLFSSETLRALGAQVSLVTGLTGAFCFQVRGQIERDEWQVIDVNPRVGGGTPMSVAAGLNFPAANVSFMLGQDPAPFFRSLPSKDIYVTRSFREHVSWPNARY